MFLYVFLGLLSIQNFCMAHSMIVGRGVLTPFILWIPPPSLLPTPLPFFKFCPTPPPFLVVSLAEWVIVPYLIRYFNDIMDLHMSSLGRTFLMCVLCKKLSSLLRSDTCGFLLVLWFDITHTSTHTYTQSHTSHSGAKRLTHPYNYIIYLHHLLCSHNSYFYYNE